MKCPIKGLEAECIGVECPLCIHGKCGCITSFDIAGISDSIDCVTTALDKIGALLEKQSVLRRQNM